MMTLAQIESSLVYWFQPSYLSVVQESEYIFILISSRKFENKTIDNRHAMVYNFINMENVTILTCYTPEEMEELLEWVL